MTQSQTTAPSLLGLEEDGRDLFGLAAHKLNTPLACIRGFVSTLLQRGDQLDTETVQQFLSLVLTQTDRLQGLVRDFCAATDLGYSEESFAESFRHIVHHLSDVGAASRVQALSAPGRAARPSAAVGGEGRVGGRQRRDAAVHHAARSRSTVRLLPLRISIITALRA